MIKYRTGGLGSLIEAVEVEKETEKCVWIKYKYETRREAKGSGYRCYFDAWEAAHAYLLQKAENECAGCRRRLEEANGHLGNIKGMKKPE
jgi:hypothetical protein